MNQNRRSYKKTSITTKFQQQQIFTRRIKPHINDVYYSKKYHQFIKIIKTLTDKIVVINTHDIYKKIKHFRGVILLTLILNVTYLLETK